MRVKSSFEYKTVYAEVGDKWGRLRGDFEKQNPEVIDKVNKSGEAVKAAMQNFDNARNVCEAAWDEYLGPDLTDELDQVMNDFYASSDKNKLVRHLMPEGTFLEDTKA